MPELEEGAVYNQISGLKRDLAVLVTKFDQYVLITGMRDRHVIDLEKEVQLLKLWQASISGSISAFRYLLGGGILISLTSVGLAIIPILQHIH